MEVICSSMMQVGRLAVGRFSAIVGVILCTDSSVTSSAAGGIGTRAWSGLKVGEQLEGLLLGLRQCHRVGRRCVTTPWLGRWASFSSMTRLLVLRLIILNMRVNCELNYINRSSIPNRVALSVRVLC